MTLLAIISKCGGSEKHKDHCAKSKKAFYTWVTFYDYDYLLHGMISGGSLGIKWENQYKENAIEGSARMIYEVCDKNIIFCRKQS